MNSVPDKLAWAILILVIFPCGIGILYQMTRDFMLEKKQWREERRREQEERNALAHARNRSGRWRP